MLQKRATIETTRERSSTEFVTDAADGIFGKPKRRNWWNCPPGIVVSDDNPDAPDLATLLRSLAEVERCLRSLLLHQERDPAAAAVLKSIRAQVVEKAMATAMARLDDTEQFLRRISADLDVGAQTRIKALKSANRSLDVLVELGVRA
jgi:hypothetical protein